MNHRKTRNPLSLEKAEQMLSKSLCSTKRELFERIVKSNPALQGRISWGKVLWLFFDELFPRPRRSLSLAVTIAGVMVATLLSWNLFFSSLTEEGLGNPSEIVQEDIPSDGLNIGWEEDVGSLIAGKFWIE